MTNTNSIQLFNYGENPVRTILQDGEIWFVAKDICDILEIKNVTQALSTLDDDEKMTLSNAYSHETSGKCGGASTLKVINESGLYALIFKSIKPEAREFRKWVTGTVLPQIRRTGTFTVEQLGQTQTEQKALPGLGVRAEMETTKQRIEYFRRLLDGMKKFEHSVFTFRDNGISTFPIYPDYTKDDKSDLYLLTDLLDVFKSFSERKLQKLQDNLKALETLAKF